MSNTVGILPVFEDGEILLGKEFNDRSDRLLWDEFRGKQNTDETMVEAACRLFNENTSYIFHLKVDQVVEAERRGDYIDYFDFREASVYRMYIVRLKFKPKVELLCDGRIFYVDISKKIDWRYFPIDEIEYVEEIPKALKARVKLIRKK